MKLSNTNFSLLLDISTQLLPYAISLQYMSINSKGENINQKAKVSYASDSLFLPSSPRSLSSDWLLLRTTNCPSLLAWFGLLEAAINLLCSSKS